MTIWIIKVRWFFLSFAIFVLLHETLAVISKTEIDDSVQGIQRLLCSALMSYAVYSDTHHKASQGRHAIAGWMFFLWPIIGPFYLIQTRGWKGLGLSVVFAASLVGIYMLPHLLLGLLE